MSAYDAPIANLLGAIRSAALARKMIMLNTAEYITPADSIDAVAAGAVHLELFNNFKYSGNAARWQWIEHLGGDVACSWTS